jgi:hypothetical protein
VIFKHHGSDYKKIFDSKYRRILTAKKIKEWKENGLFANLSSLDDPDEKVKFKNELIGIINTREAWNWAAEKMGISLTNLANLWNKCGLKRNIEELKTEANDASDYPTMEAIMVELKSHPSFASQSQSWKNKIEKKNLQLKINWLFAKATEENNLDELKKIKTEIKVNHMKFC